MKTLNHIEHGNIGIVGQNSEKLFFEIAESDFRNEFPGVNLDASVIFMRKNDLTLRRFADFIVKNEIDWLFISNQFRFIDTEEDFDLAGFKAAMGTICNIFWQIGSLSRSGILR
jgi:hypothetical protein